MTRTDIKEIQRLQQELDHERSLRIKERSQRIKAEQKAKEYKQQARAHKAALDKTQHQLNASRAETETLTQACDALGKAISAVQKISEGLGADGHTLPVSTKP